MAAPEKIVFGIQMPEYHDVWIKRWAYIKGRARATMASDIVQARIEANLDQIKEMYADLAKQKGLTTEELDALIGIDGEED